MNNEVLTERNETKHEQWSRYCKTVISVISKEVQILFYFKRQKHKQHISLGFTGLSNGV